MLAYMVLIKTDGSIRLCKSKHGALGMLIRRGYIEIEAQEWKRLLAEKRSLALPEEKEGD